MGCCCRKETKESPADELKKDDEPVVGKSKGEEAKERTPQPSTSEELDEEPSTETEEGDVVVEQETLSTVSESSLVEWYPKVGISTTDPSLLIRGYENEPLVSLEESLEPFEGHIQHLDAQIRQAKTHCHYPSEHHLTHDESATIYLYSMRGDNNSVREHLHRALDSGDRSQLEPWFRYLKLLRSGLDKVPNVKSEVWQGAAYDPDLANTLQSDSLTSYTSMGSSSTSPSNVKKGPNAKSGSRMIQAGYKSINGKELMVYTEGNAKEVMDWLGVKLEYEKNEVVDEDGVSVSHSSGQPDPPEPESPSSSLPEESPVIQVLPPEPDSISSSSSEQQLIPPKPEEPIKPHRMRHFVCPAKGRNGSLTW